MALSNAEFIKLWKQVPDQHLWKNVDTGEVVSINGSTDQAWYTVRRTVTLPEDGGFGSVKTEQIAPYFLLRSKPVGDMGTQSNIRIQGTGNWRRGTFDDALNAAYRYMRNYYSNKKR